MYNFADETIKQEKMKAFKQQIGGLSVVAKFAPKKGQDDIIVIKVYLEDEFGQKKIGLGDEWISQRFGLNTSEEKSEFCKYWQVNFFVDGLVSDRKGWVYSGEEKHLVNISRGWHIHLGYGFLWNKGYVLRGINQNRDYFTLEVEKDIFMNHSISMKLIHNDARSKCYLCSDEDAFATPFEYETLFTIPALSENQLEKKHKANRRGFNDDVFKYCVTFQGLRGIPEVKTEKEFEEWYNTLTQEDADLIRRGAKTYCNSLYGGRMKDASERQINYIKKMNGESYIIKYTSKSSDGTISMPLASAIIEELLIQRG